MFLIPLPQILVPILRDIGTVPLLNHSMCLTQYVMFFHLHDPVLQRLLPLLIMQQLFVMHLILQVFVVVAVGLLLMESRLVREGTVVCVEKQLVFQGQVVVLILLLVLVKVLGLVVVALLDLVVGQDLPKVFV